MIPRCGAALTAALVCAVSLPLSSSAAERRYQPVPPGTVVHHQSVGGPTVSGVCQSGVVAGTPDVLGDLFPPNDTYFTLIHPTQCSSCSLATLTSAHIMMQFHRECSIPVEITVLAAVGTTCLQPDFVHVLCPTFATTIDGGVSVDPSDFAIALPSGCQISQDAFLCVNFVASTDSCSADADQPQIGIRAGCPHCQSYENIDGGGLEDVCQFGVGQPIMYVDIGQCVLTPALKRSWGTLRILYR